MTPGKFVPFNRTCRVFYLANAGGTCLSTWSTLDTMEWSRREISVVNRTVAFVLAVVWLCAGIGAVCLGFAQARWLVVVLGLFALGYALLWLRVAVRRRLLTWSRLIAPWRTR